MSDGFLVLRGEGGGDFAGFGPDGPMVAGPACGVALRFADSEELGRYLAELPRERALLLTGRFRAVEVALPKKDG